MAGAGVRDFKRRIRSVKSTQQITKAMKMVAAAKLRRAQERAETSRPYTESLRVTLAHLDSSEGEEKFALLQVREEVKKVAYVVVTADKGLCGAYNTNIIRLANETMAQDERPVENAVIAVGRKSRDFYRKRQDLLEAEFIGLGDNVSYSDAKDIADYIINAYEIEEYDEVYVVYAKFVNTIRQVPTVSRVLPVEPPASDEALAEVNIKYIYEPNADAILFNLLPRYVGSQIYHAMLEGKASEFGARMTAMSNATENAGEIIDNLTLKMNKVRQAAITDEILDIVGGSEALKK